MVISVLGRFCSFSSSPHDSGVSRLVFSRYYHTQHVATAPSWFKCLGQTFEASSWKNRVNDPTELRIPWKPLSCSSRPTWTGIIRFWNVIASEVGSSSPTRLNLVSLLHIFSVFLNWRCVEIISKIFWNIDIFVLNIFIFLFSLFLFLLILLLARFYLSHTVYSNTLI